MCSVAYEIAVQCQYVNKMDEVTQCIKVNVFFLGPAWAPIEIVARKDGLFGFFPEGLF